MNPEVHLVEQFTSVFRVYLKRSTSLPLQNEFRDLKSVFPSWENTSKGGSKRSKMILLTHPVVH